MAKRKRETTATEDAIRFSEELIRTGLFDKEFEEEEKEKEEEERRKAEEARLAEERIKKQAEEEKLEQERKEREQMEKVEEEKFENEFLAIIKEAGFASKGFDFSKEKKQLFIDLYYGNKKTSEILPKINLLDEKEYQLTTKVVEQLVVRKFRNVCEKNGIDMTEEKISAEIQSVIKQKTQKYYKAIEDESKKQKKNFEARQVKEKKKMKKIAENIKI